MIKLQNEKVSDKQGLGGLSMTQISAKHWEKAMLHAKWDTLTGIERSKR